MNCNELRASLEPLLDNETDIGMKSRMLDHMEDCVDCHAAWEELQNLKANLHSYQSMIQTPSRLRGKIRDMLLGDPPNSNVMKLVPQASQTTPAKGAVSYHDTADITRDFEPRSGVGDFVDQVTVQVAGKSITSQLLQEDLDFALSKLSPQERDLMRLRFGLEDGIQRTLEEVAQLYGVTRERIRQIEAKALRKLRPSSRKRSVRNFGE